MNIILTTIPSDAHTWNLIYMQLALEERGHAVTNLGACTQTTTLISQCLEIQPDLIVVSSINGHAYIEGVELLNALKAHSELQQAIVVIGGKLCVNREQNQMAYQKLRDCGFDAIFDDKEATLQYFDSFLESISAVNKLKKAK